MNGVEQGMHVVQFYSKSKERDDVQGIDKNWRKILSNFCTRELTIDGHTYSSAEHAFHAAKCGCSDNPSVQTEFTVAGKVGNKPEDAKRAGGRKGFKSLGAELDLEKWDRVKRKEMMKILEARWEQHPDFQEVLRALYPRIKNDNWYLLHFERSGKKSEWGGTYSAEAGVKGQNLLGRLLMQLVATKLESKKRKKEESDDACSACDVSPAAKRTRE